MGDHETQDVLPEDQSARPLGDPYLAALLSLFIKHTPAAVAMFDRDMRYLMYSDRWAETFPYKGESLMGKGYYEVFPEVPARWKKVHQRCLMGVTESCIEDPLPREEDLTDYIDWTVAPWYNGDRTVGGLIIFMELVTSRVEARRRLELAIKSKDESQRRMESFLRALSENLHEPLQNASYMVGHLQEKIQEATPAWDQHQYILTQLQRSIRLVENMEVYVGGKIGEDTYTNVAMLTVLSRVVVELDKLIHDKQVTLSYSYLPIIKGNELELMALVKQLLSNAIEVSADQLLIRISVVRQDRFWQFEVADNGPGMSAETEEELFDQYRKIDSHKRNPRGISLPICRRIVERMGGQLWVKSTLGKGTSFFFTLPIRKED